MWCSLLALILDILFQILLYLRTCLAHSAGLKPDMESLATMKEQAPAISEHVQGLLRDHSSETGPVQLYVELIRKLLKAVGGKLEVVPYKWSRIFYILVNGASPFSVLGVLALGLANRSQNDNR